MSLSIHDDPTKIQSGLRKLHGTSVQSYPVRLYSQVTLLINLDPPSVLQVAVLRPVEEVLWRKRDAAVCFGIQSDLKLKRLRLVQELEIGERMRETYRDVFCSREMVHAKVEPDDLKQKVNNCFERWK